MKHYKLILVLAICAFKCEKPNNQNDSKAMAEDINEKRFADNMHNDLEFAISATDGGMLEVMLGKLSQKNAYSSQVKEFGRVIITDHSKANDELKSLAGKKKIMLPMALSEKNLEIYNSLTTKKGIEFDKAYIEFMMKDHKEDIEEFQEEAEKGKDNELKNWASRQVQLLHHHLQMAESINIALK